MTAGNPRRVAVLAVAAVGAIAYLGYSALGLGIGGPPMAAIRTADEKAAASPTALPTALDRDVFYHPKVSAVYAKAPGSQTQAENEAGPETTLRPPSMPGRVPSGDGLAPVQPNVIQLPSPEVRPGENAGFVRQPDRAPGARVRLTAIVIAVRKIAFLTVDGMGSKAFREGDLVRPGLRLLKIEDSGVKMRTAKRRMTISVGSEVSL